MNIVNNYNMTLGKIKEKMRFILILMKKLQKIAYIP